MTATSNAVVTYLVQHYEPRTTVKRPRIMMAEDDGVDANDVGADDAGADDAERRAPMYM